jgi:type I restriction enzyme, S subunit
MKQYRLVKIGDICKLKSGKSLPKDLESENGEIPYVKVSDMNLKENNKYIVTSSSFVKLNDSKNYVFPIGSVIFPKRGGAIGTNKKRLTKCEICADLNIMAVIPGKEILPEYLYAYFNGVDLGQLSNGSSVPQINNGDIAPLLIPLPDIKIQKKIASLLFKAQELIDKRKEQIEALDELVKSKFIEMFGIPLANTKGWNEQLAGEVCLKITDGSHFSPKDCSDSNIPMLSVKDMMADRFSYDSCKHVSEEDYIELKKNGCKPLLHDVLIAKDGSYFYYGFVLEEEIEQALLSSISILRPNKDLVNPYYLRYYMMSQEVVDLVGKKYVSGAALKRVILKGIRQIPVMIPPIELQNQFADFVNQVDKLKSEMEKSLKELEDNFNSLMQRAFKGELF